MAEDKPKTNTEGEFDDMVDDAAYGAIEHFESLGLPDEGTPQRLSLLEDLAQAIEGVMREWK